jgi:alpha-tubulin suppressor-like RCC1 family protein
MRRLRPHAIVFLVALAAALGGCGETLYDATHVPLQCSDPTAPLVCGHACMAEDADHCGASCSQCQQFDHATAFCDTSSLDLAQHACDYTCQPGFERDPNGPGCRCPVGTALCGGTCVAQDVNHCGATCQVCASAPANATPGCNLTASTCDFTCSAGMVPSGNSCICAGGTVACGGGAAGGACVSESATACGASCQTCTVPAGATNATPVCNAVHQCDYLCPATFHKCTTGCCATTCAAPAITCGQSCAAEIRSPPTQCGPSCADCTNPATNPLPANGIAACLGLAGQGTCTFQCPAGFLKSNGACVQVAALAAVKAPVALGAAHTCVVTNAGGLMCWGANGSGQLGVGDTTDRLTPTDVTLAGNATPGLVAAGVSHTCAVTTGGAVQCWGSNATGQLGQPLSVTSSWRPLAVPFVTDAVAVAAGAGHTCVILVGGSVTCWGANDKGQAGIGTPSPAVFPSLSPVKLGGAAADQIATQLDHTCIVESAGAVWCWGANAKGQTGQGDPTTPAPALVSKLTANGPIGGVPTIAVGGQHTCVLGKFNGASSSGVYCWGDNSVAQLGTSVSIPAGFTATPTPASKIVPGGNKPASMFFTGRAHTCNAGADGSVICGGANDQLQTGDPAAAPSQPKGPGIALAPAPDAIFGGGDRGCALQAGVLACWGANGSGQLGNSSTANTAIPVPPVPF